MKTVIARHCRTAYNAHGLMQGHIDIPLDDTGWKQAVELARGVRSYGLVGIWCSDLARSMQTAEIVAELVGVTVTVDRRLRECGFGTLDGLSFPQFALKCGFRNLPMARLALQADFTRFGGERGIDVYDRQVELLEDLKIEHDDETVMIVGHGRSLRTLLAPLRHPHKWLRNQGSHIVIDY